MAKQHKHSNTVLIRKWLFGHRLHYRTQAVEHGQLTQNSHEQSETVIWARLFSAAA